MCDDVYDDIGDYYDEHGIACDCEECRLENTMDECGLLPDHLGGGCMKAGSEHCDFDCPLRDMELEEED